MTLITWSNPAGFGNRKGCPPPPPAPTPLKRHVKVIKNNNTKMFQLLPSKIISLHFVCNQIWFTPLCLQSNLVHFILSTIRSGSLHFVYNYYYNQIQFTSHCLQIRFTPFHLQLHFPMQTRTKSKTKTLMLTTGSCRSLREEGQDSPGK